MSVAFDPYHKWLGILPKDQPPHHYRLLGLEPFEGDLQVIEGAADRQIGFLRKFQSGEQAAACQKLLNEVSRARLCLLKPAAKAAYDNELRIQLAGPKSAFEIDPILAKSGTRGPSRTASPLAWVSAGALLLSVVGGLVFFFQGNDEVNKPVQPAVAKVAPATKPVELTSTTVAKPGLSTPEAPKATDLLALLRPEHILRGQWKIQKDRLESLGFERHSQVTLPVTAPAEYTLHLEGTRLADPDAPTNTCGVGLVCGEHCCIVGMDVDPKLGVSGMEMIDDQFWNLNPTTLPGLRTTIGKPFQMDAIVRHDGVECRIDGRTICDWQGSFNRLKRASYWSFAGPKQLYVAAESKYVFTKITLGPPLPRRTLPGADLKVGESVELLKFVDVKQDVWQGDWLKEGLTMKSSPDSDTARFSVPYQAPEEYELIADIQGTSPGHDFYLGIPLQQGHAGIGIGGPDTETNFLLLDSATPGPPLILQRQRALTEERNKIIVTVRKNHLTVKIRDLTICDWKGNPRRFAAWWQWATPGNRITVGTHHVSYRIHSLKLTRLAPAPDVLPQPKTPQNGDLLAIVNVQRDTRRGFWTPTAKGFLSSSDRPCNLCFPAKLPPNYEFRFVVERKSDLNGIVLALPVAGRAVAPNLDGWNQKLSGIDWMEGKPANDNSTTIRRTEPLLLNGQPAVIQGRVEGSHLKLQVNDQTLFDLDIPPTLPDPSWLGREGWSTPDERLQISVQTWLTAFEIHEARFRPLDPNSPPFPPLTIATVTKPKEPTPGQPLVSNGLLTTGTTPVPDAAAQEAAMKKLQEIFHEEYADSKKDADKLSFAQKLETLSEDTKDDPAAKFVCLEEARRLAAESGDLTKAFALVDTLGLEFKTDALELKASTVKNVGPKLKGLLLNKELVDKALPLIDQLLDAERYKSAVDVAVTATQAAVKVKDKALQIDTQNVRKEAEELAKDFAIADKAREMLQTKPDDAEANLAWGRWQCFSKDNWPEGLKLLQRAGDERLKELATRDLKAPTDKTETLQLGTDWIDYAKSTKDHSRSDFATRALHWLAKAQVESTGLTRSRIESLMEQAVSLRDWNSPQTGLLEAIHKKVALRKYVLSAEIVHPVSARFEQIPTDGGILVGFKCYSLPWRGEMLIRGLQPIYATQTGLRMGVVTGMSDGTEVQLMARPGYAVNGISCLPDHPAHAVANLQLSFARITKTGLDSKRSYFSLIVGRQKSTEKTELVNSGNQPIVGVFGHADDFVRGLGLVIAK